MKKIKVFSTLDHLNTYELNRFEKFVNSPYFNSNQGLIKLLDLYLQSKKNTRVKLDKPALWSCAFGDKKFNDNRLRKALSDLLKLLEDFLCLEHMNDNPIYKSTILVEALEERKIEELYNSAVKNAKTLTSEANNASATMHYHRYELEKNYYALTDFDVRRKELSNLPQIISNLDHFYLAEKLKYYCTSLSRSTFVNQEFELLFIDEIKEHIKVHKYKDVPIVSIWISIYFLQASDVEDSESYYKEFRKTFSDIIGQLPKKEALQIFGYAQNYCARQINRGNDQFFKELFELNKIALDNNILVEKDELDPWLFRNLVTVALRLQEFEWTEVFIRDYSLYISENYRENAVAYSRALLHFYRKEYDSTLEELNKIKTNDISYDLNINALRILTYFETDEITALDSLLSSFSVYINRHKSISKRIRENYVNMISFTRRLMNTLPSDRKAHEKMLVRLNKTKGIASAAWLKEKIEERLN